MHSGQYPADLRFDGYRRIGFNIPDGTDLYGNGLLDYNTGCHRHRRFRGGLIVLNMQKESLSDNRDYEKETLVYFFPVSHIFSLTFTLPSYSSVSCMLLSPYHLCKTYFH